MKRIAFVIMREHNGFGSESKSYVLSLCHNSFILHRIVWDLRFQSGGCHRVRLSSKEYEVLTTCREIDDIDVNWPERTMRLTGGGVRPTHTLDST